MQKHAANLIKSNIVYNNNWKRLLKFFFSFFFTVGLFQYIGQLLAGLHINHHTQKPTTSQSFVINIFSLIGVFVIVWLFRRCVDKEPFKSIGFQKTNFTNVILGLLIGFTIMLLGFLSLLIFGQITVIGFGYHFSEFAISIGLFTVVAITEELVVRGYVLSNLMGAFNKYYALFISAIVFSSLHLANPHVNALSLLNLFLSGILLGLPYIYTKNLWFSIALHFSWNFCQGTIFGFNVSGNNFYSIIIQRTVSNNVWTGGSFGFEGSIFCIFLQIIAIYLVFRIFRSNNDNTPIITVLGLLQERVTQLENKA